jgi:hypothetical protein
MTNIAVNMFNGGEVTPHIDARFDIDKYASSCRRMENMLPRVYGDTDRRSGTRFIAKSKNSPENVRMIDFVYSTEIVYKCEIGDMYIRFYYGHEPLIDGGIPVEVASPYTEADLPLIQYKQIGDVMTLTHPDYAQRKLVRVSPTTFSLYTIPFENGPFQTRNDWANDDDVTMTCTAVAAGSTGTLSCSSAYFEDGHAGCLFKLIHPRTDTTVTLVKAATETGASDALKVRGPYRMLTESTGSVTWAGTLVLERSEDGGTTWDAFRTFETSTVNFNHPGDELEENIQYRMNMTAHTVGAFKATLTNDMATVEGVVRVDSVTNSTTATVTVTRDLDVAAATLATKRWAEGAWSGVAGYPAAVGFHQGRIVYLATYAQPANPWLSATDDYENFVAGGKDADSFDFQMLTTNSGCWVESLGDVLMAGTTGGPWSISSNKLNTPLTPSNIVCKQATTDGCARMQALRVGSAILYADSVKRKIRELAENPNGVGFVSADLTRLAKWPYSTTATIVGMAHQKNPESILWVILSNGWIVSCTYEREEGVVGWARHPMAGATDKIQYNYPLLRPGDPVTLPTKPTAPADTALVTPTSITNAVGLQAIALAPTAHYELANDIDMTGVLWNPIVDFAGVLEGNGYSIKNWQHTGPTEGDNVALFYTTVAGAEIRNLNLTDCAITWYGDPEAILSENGAILIASVEGDTVVKDVAFTNCSITIPAGAAVYQQAMLAGQRTSGSLDVFDCTFTNCAINAPRHPSDEYSEGTWETGFVAGYVTDNGSVATHINVVDCTIDGGSITASGDIGAIFGYVSLDNPKSTLVVYTCTSSASITCDQEFVGGLIGEGPYIYGDECYAYIVSCEVTGPISNNAPDDGQFVGGLLGNGPVIQACRFSNASVLNCHVEADITVTSSSDIFGAPNHEFIGGCLTQVEIAVGTDGSGDENSILIADSDYTGNITVSSVAGGACDYVGGFVGLATSNQMGQWYIDWAQEHAAEIERGYWDSTEWDGTVGAEGYTTASAAKGFLTHSVTLDTWHTLLDDKGDYDGIEFLKGQIPDRVYNFIEGSLWKCGNLKHVLFDDLWWGDYVQAAGWPLGPSEWFGEDASGSSVVFKNCYSDCTIQTSLAGDTTAGITGGFAGQIDSNVLILLCHSTGTITTTVTNTDSESASNVYLMGGFVGIVYPTNSSLSPLVSTTISRCYSTVDLACVANNGHTTSAGSVDRIGAFAGTLDSNFNVAGGAVGINNCYAWGNVTCTVTMPDGVTATTGATVHDVGGFVGNIEQDTGCTTTLRNVYAVGSVTTTAPNGVTYTGGLNGQNGYNDDPGDVILSYWDTEHSGVAESDGGIGRATIPMKIEENYPGWDFHQIWYMDETKAVVSVCVTPGATEDEVWLAITREIEGENEVYIEQMQPRDWRPHRRDMWFVDCGILYDDVATTTITGLDHLEGKEVAILGNGAYYGRQTVVDGQVTTSDPVTPAIVGLPYDSWVQPMRIVMAGGGAATAGSITKVGELVVSFLDTLGARYGDSEDNLYEIPWRTQEAYGIPETLFTGDQVLGFEGGFNLDNPILIGGSDPLPITVRCITARFNAPGR